MKARPTSLLFPEKMPLLASSLLNTFATVQNVVRSSAVSQKKEPIWPTAFGAFKKRVKVSLETFLPPSCKESAPKSVAKEGEPTIDPTISHTFIFDCYIFARL